MKEEIDWKALAFQLGTLKPEEPGESGGSRYAQQAIELLLGEDNLRKAVDHYVAGEPGFELARSMLRLIRPWSAAERCYELYRSEKEVETRLMAVVLLRDVADERALSWVGEFLEDEDAGIQGWGVGVLEQLLYWGFIEVEDAEPLILKAEGHANIHVREQAALIRGLMARRGDRKPSGDVGGNFF